MLETIFSFILAERRRRRTPDQLMQLDDDQLADIGLNRGQLIDCARAGRRKLLEEKDTMSCG